ncbi:hypothetical protein EJD96_00060 (plasmid) [Herbaspirillum seropedicae]|uniref:hypothetical protein n=1 Tax=Herbaspirillum seropedicae TaxID=964 RepID=UPI00111F89E0|nr:hypothetical protein [Herbaspirillum seropedicae]QDD62647.1 hypothetical protein EJD96_00060 [Herbaspirillum seropedicae]
MTANQLIDGAQVKMGGKEWVIPALSLGQIKRLAPKIESLANMSNMLTSDQVSNVCEIVHAALKRNYPDVTIEEVEDMVDMGNMRQVIQTVMGQAGLVARGEAQAVKS